MIQQMRTSPIQRERIIYQMTLDGNGFYEFKGGMPWDLMDIMEERGKRCILTIEEA